MLSALLDAIEQLAPRQTAVSRHLKVLEEAALISRSRSGKWRASHLEAAALREAADWIDRFRRFWNTSLDRLDAHLAAVQAADRLDKKEL
jgi:DNA-binding MarR family transcriptional regulator